MYCPLVPWAGDARSPPSHRLYARSTFHCVWARHFTLFQDCWSQPSLIALCRINLHLGDASSDEGRGMIPPEALALLVEVPIVVSTCFKLPARQGLRNRECSMFFCAPFFLIGSRYLPFLQPLYLCRNCQLAGELGQVTTFAGNSLSFFIHGRCT